MEFIDALFRFSGIGFLLLLATMVWRDHRQWIGAPYLILACLSVAALFAGYTLDVLKPPRPIYEFVRFVDIPHLVFVWLFALSLFNPKFQLRAWHVLVGVLYAAPILWLRLGLIWDLPDRPQWLIAYGSLTSILLMAHLCFATLSGRADDLLEQRRASRLYFVIAIAIVAFGAAASDLLPVEIAGFDKRTVKIISIWIAIVWGTLWMLSFNKPAISFGLKTGSGRVWKDRDDALQSKLQTAMTGAHMYREQSLTIRALASRLGVSEHQLRALIRDRLGYPNFSAFVNDHRIEAVKAAFESADTSHLPILTIAMNNGFRSLSPFNRAFREKEGMTPTEYRKTLAGK
ncbi:MAG: helix-turn-helix transcriptional regulator [Pseudomonadota bacterium]